MYVFLVLSCARGTIISMQDPPHYHIASRCVRRTYLCGKDYKTDQNYEHRRVWIADRIRLIFSIFSIDICSYAVMSNHYHLVVKIDPETSNHWDNDTVIKHWTTLFKSTPLIRRYKNGGAIDGRSAANLYGVR